jgi:mono/diheme cytochrome c family protein
MPETTSIEQDAAAPLTVRHRSASMRWLPALLVGVVVAVAPFAASAAKLLTGPSDDVLVLGAEVYAASCASCHQAGGAGIPGQFPPLAGNPNVDDAAYVDDVIRNGLSGKVEVNGETYDAVMPAQSTLSDDDIAAVIAYIQSGFVTPGPEVVPEVADGSGSSNVMLAIYATLGVVALAGAVVFRHRIIAVNDPREIPWSDAWMKAGVLVVGLILTTTLIPSWTWESGPLQDLSSTQRDLITIGVWSVGLGGSLVALWYLHRKHRI